MGIVTLNGLNPKPISKIDQQLLEMEREIVAQIHDLEADLDKNWPQIKLLTEELLEIQRRQPCEQPRTH